MGKCAGAITKNKKISWGAEVRTTEGLQNRNYANLTDLCLDLDIHRSNVYKIRNGLSRPVRKKHIISITKYRLE